MQMGQICRDGPPCTARRQCAHLRTEHSEVDSLGSGRLSVRIPPGRGGATAHVSGALAIPIGWIAEAVAQAFSEGDDLGRCTAAAGIGDMQFRALGFGPHID